MLYNLFFSPTGGSKKVASIISDELDKNHIDVDLLLPQKALSLTSSDLALFTFPSFGGRCPSIALERIQNIYSRGTKAVLVAVFGNRAIDDTLLEMKNEIEKRGFQIVAAIEAVAEHSLMKIYGIGRPDEEDKLELIDFAKRIKAKKESTLPSLPGKFPYKVFPGSSIKPLTSDECIDCKLCIKQCPVNAINENNPKLIDKDKCIGCLHCISICPVKAKKLDSDQVQDIQKKLENSCKERKENKLYI